MSTPETDVSPESQANQLSQPEMSADTVTIDRQKVVDVLNLLRPYLQADGGDVELVDVTSDGVVQLRLQGACGSCPSSTYTLKMGIEEQMKQYVPGVKEVVSV